MAMKNAGMSGSRGARQAWLHFVGLIVLVGVVELFALVQAELDAAGVRGGLLVFFYDALPILAAVSVGMLGFDGSVPRQAALLAAVATLLMVALDVVPATAGTSGVPSLPLQDDVFQRRSLATNPQGPGVIRTALAFMRGDLVLGPERLARYAPDHPRWLAAQAVFRGGLLMFPGILVGVILGIRAWVADHVTFRRAVDERVARVLLAWVCAPAVFFLVLTWSMRVQVQVLFGDSGMAAVLLPYVPVVLIAAVGWVTSWRASPWTAD